LKKKGEVSRRSTYPYQRERNKESDSPWKKLLEVFQTEIERELGWGLTKRGGGSG